MANGQQSPNVNSNDYDTNKKMVDKVNQQMAADEDSLMARVIGLGLIVLGVVFILLAIVVVTLSRRNATVDDELAIPTVETREVTNEREIRISGSADKDARVTIFVNGEEQDKQVEVADDGVYQANIPVDTEGEYEIEVAAVKGFPLKKTSDRSEIVKVTVDWTPPVAEADLDFEPVVRGEEFTLKGNVEPNAKVIVKGLDDQEYTARADASGDFTLGEIALPDEKNTFTVVLEDQAGNQRELSSKVEVTNSLLAKGDLNGDGVIDGPEIPEAAGELDRALDILMGNSLMAFFAILAIGVFAINGGVVALKLGKEKAI